MLLCSVLILILLIGVFPLRLWTRERPLTTPNFDASYIFLSQAYTLPHIDKSTLSGDNGFQIVVETIEDEQGHYHQQGYYNEYDSGYNYKYGHSHGHDHGHEKAGKKEGEKGNGIEYEIVYLDGSESHSSSSSSSSSSSRLVPGDDWVREMSNVDQTYVVEMTDRTSENYPNAYDDKTESNRNYYLLLAVVGVVICGYLYRLWMTSNRKILQAGLYSCVEKIEQNQPSTDRSKKADSTYSYRGFVDLDTLDVSNIEHGEDSLG